MRSVVAKPVEGRLAGLGELAGKVLGEDGCAIIDADSKRLPIWRLHGRLRGFVECAGGLFQSLGEGSCSSSVAVSHVGGSRLGSSVASLLKALSTPAEPLSDPL